MSSEDTAEQASSPVRVQQELLRLPWVPPRHIPEKNGEIPLETMTDIQHHHEPECMMLNEDLKFSEKIARIRITFGFCKPVSGVLVRQLLWGK